MLEETKQSLLKKVNDAEHIAESLDNTAPFKAIIAAIDQNKKKEKTISYLIHTTVRRRHQLGYMPCMSDFLYPSQPRNAFSEDWDGALNSGFFESISHKSLMPWIITKLKHIGRRTDPVTDLLSQTHNWNQTWISFQSAYYKTKKISYKWLSDDVLYCPKMFIEMAEHIETKPDKFFGATYNWYYAGKGNMLVAQFGGGEYLIHSEFNCVNMSPFFKDTLSIDSTNTKTYKCSDDIYILETIYSQPQNIIAIRTKYKVIILKVATCDGDLTFERLKEMDSELPFTSISFDEYHRNIMYVTTLDYLLTIVNLDRMTGRTKKLRGKFTSLVDNWSSVIGGERGFYTHVTKRALAMYDKRTNEPFQRWKTFRLATDIETCSAVSAAKYSEGNPMLYVGTAHHLFLMDMRCGNTKSTNIKPAQRWSHGMLVPPSYMDICKIDPNSNKEMVCLTSQWVEDMCVVSNYSDRATRTGEIKSLSEPYRPPSILHTFNEARRRKLCCNLGEPIRHRLCNSLSGMSITGQGDNYVVLLQNSLGDISCHTLCPEAMVAFVADDGTEKLNEWSKDFKEADGDKEPFEVSYVFNITTFLKELCKVPNDYILGRNSVIEPKINFSEKEIVKTYSKQELDPEFLEIWKEHDEHIELDTTGMSPFFVDTS